jgi:hypothetical protein
VPLVAELKVRILQELEQNLPKLLTLNPSRREAIKEHLERLASQSSGESLNAWVEGPRTPAQNQALATYFEELALLFLSQALLLKAWSDRGIRKWTQTDLAQLNWALSSALKPHLPLDREGWHRSAVRVT